MDRWFAKKAPLPVERRLAATCPAKTPRSDSKGRSPNPEGPLRITLTDAVLLTLGASREFRVERLQPAIESTSQGVALGAFDPELSMESEYQRERTAKDAVDMDFSASTRVSKFLPSGTTLGMEAKTDWNHSFEDTRSGTSPSYHSNPTGGYSGSDQDTESDWKSQVKLSVTQALLQGRGADVNLANLRQARLDTFSSQYELQGKAESLAARAQNLYWDYYSALGRIRINRQSLDLAKRLIDETRERIRLGQRARSEIYSVQAEAASREQGLIDARSALEKTRLQLLRLVNPPSPDLWNLKIKLLTPPRAPNESFEHLEDHIQLAMRMRPDLNQARLAVQRGELEIVKTRNGILPKLDLFAELGRTGYSSSFSGSVSDITQGAGGLDVRAGAQFEYPLLNNKAKAQYKKAILSQAQQKEALDNLVQLVEEDVLLAYVEIRRSRQEIRAAAATVEFQREKRDAEIEKFRLGKSSTFRISQAERDLVQSQLSHLQSIVDLLKGLTQLYYVEGALLARMGISLPQCKP